MADIQYFSGLPEVGVVPTERPFAYDPARLDDVRGIADRLAGARDELRPKE